MSFEDEYQRRGKKKSSIAPWLPAMGFILLVAFGAIAFVLSEPVHEFIYEQFFLEDEIQNNVPLSESFGREEIQYVVGVVIFLLVTMLGGLFYAMFAPKPAAENRVTERDMKREREAKLKEQMERKKRKQVLNKQYAAERARREKEQERNKSRRQ
ncbi:MAG: hypothetical protein ACOCX5_02175 [Chloroflexota bacterium]